MGGSGLNQNAPNPKEAPHNGVLGYLAFGKIDHSYLV